MGSEFKRGPSTYSDPILGDGPRQLEIIHQNSIFVFPYFYLETLVWS